MTKPWAIHWFRRDLRLLGNLALLDQIAKYQGRVLGLFAFDEAFLSRSDFSHDRFQFFLETLDELRREMRSRGGDLLVLGQGPDSTFAEIMDVCQKTRTQLPSAVTWNRDYEPFARKRDERILAYLSSHGVPVHTYRDHLLIEPAELLKPDGSYYQVYSPFARRWLELLASPPVRDRLQRQRQVITSRSVDSVRFTCTWDDLFGKQFADQFESMVQQNRPKTTIPIPGAGVAVAWRRLEFFSKNLSAYGERRDIPSYDGTSQLSFFLKNGSLTVPQIITELKLDELTNVMKSDQGAAKFLKELIWREFYYHILWHQPHVEHEAFQARYKDIAWHNDETFFAAWKAGKTGYPIVDAGMRQLLKTGWMHNRVRMIVASFLTKDLLIDWKWGEQWFMQKLLDGDLAPNNGGWQWAASTGCDPQPYFRIFNPTSQSEKFDPEGVYIRTYVEELREVGRESIHFPSEEICRSTGYPMRIVDHARQRDLALMLYKR